MDEQKLQYAEGFIPYEPGDSVKIKTSKTSIFVIEEIRFIQYIKAKRAEFEVALSENGVRKFGWFPANVIEERIK